jgi:hypothetical protein
MEGDWGIGTLRVVAARCALAGPLVWAGRGSAGRRMRSPLAMLLIVGNDVYCEGDGGPCTATCYGDPNDPGSYSECWIIDPLGVDNTCDKCALSGCPATGYQYSQEFFQVPVGWRSSRTTHTLIETVDCFRGVTCIGVNLGLTVCDGGYCRDPDFGEFVYWPCYECYMVGGYTPWQRNRSQPGQ